MALDRAERIGVSSVAAVVLVLAAAPLALSFAISPDAIERGEVALTGPCPVRERTGRECATCGLTRGFCAMSRAEVSRASRYNRAAPWLYGASWLLALGSGAVLVRTATGGSSRGLWFSARLR